jgi:hypothetical protein
MKKIILAVFLIAGAACLHAQDTTKHKMMKKKSTDTSHHKKMGKMKKDSTK